MHLKTYTLNFTAITGKCHVYFRGTPWESSDSLTDELHHTQMKTAPHSPKASPPPQQPLCAADSIIGGLQRDDPERWNVKLHNIQAYIHSGHRHGPAHRWVLECRFEC